MVLCVTPRELTEDKPRTRCGSAVVGYPQLVTHIYVHGAEGLENQDNPGGQWAHSGLLLCQGACTGSGPVDRTRKWNRVADLFKPRQTHSHMVTVVLLTHAD